jgi:chromosome segregation ATPase
MAKHLRRVFGADYASKDFVHRIKERTSPQEVDTEALKKRKQSSSTSLKNLAQEEERSLKRLRLCATRSRARRTPRARLSASSFRRWLSAVSLRHSSHACALAKRSLRESKRHLKRARRRRLRLLGREIQDYEEYIVRDTNGTVSDADMAPRGAQQTRGASQKARAHEDQARGDRRWQLARCSKSIKRQPSATSFWRELVDLEISSQKLHELIEELTKTLEVRFTSGIEKINTEFEKFFKLMFGGGSASLSIVKEKSCACAPSDMLADIRRQ